jgi:hypothetical protein
MTQKTYITKKICFATSMLLRQWPATELVWINITFKEKQRKDDIYFESQIYDVKVKVK